MWKGRLSAFTFVKVTVHTAPGPNDHYNMDRPGIWPIKELLRVSQN